MVAEALIEVDVIPTWSPRKGSQLYEALAVTRTGSPTWLVPFGKLMQISIGPGTEAVPPSRSSAVFACDLHVLLERPAPGVLVHGRPARALVREMRLVDPVVEGLAEVEHPEQEHEQERQHERELDERHARFRALGRTTSETEATHG